MEGNTEIHAPTPELESLDIKTPEIENSAFSIQELIEQLQPAIDNHLYNAVAVDHMSGHLPGFVIGEVINNVNRNKGLPLIPVIPIDGQKKSLGLTNMRNEVDTKRPALQNIPEDSRVLLVTEYTAHGETLDNFTKLFKEMGLNYDVASLATSDDETEYKRLGIMAENARLYTSYTDYDAPEIAGNREIIGYTRGNNSDVVLDTSEEVKKKKDIAKADMHLLATFLTQKYFPK